MYAVHQNKVHNAFPTLRKILIDAFYVNANLESGGRAVGRRIGVTAISIMTLSIMTLSIMTLSIMTLSIMTLSIMTFSITTFSIMTLSITKKRHNTRQV
jgi:hypothetical protein